MTTFDLALVGRLKHGALVEAIQRRGWTQADLARALDSSPTEIGKLMNLHGTPSARWMTPERERILFDLTGKLPEDLWPAFTHDPEWQRREKRFAIVREVPIRQLQGSPQLLTDGDEYDESLWRESLRDAVRDVVATLTPREEKVLNLRFGLTGDDPWSLREVADHFGRSIERIRQTECKALHKLRHPARRKMLKPFVESCRSVRDHAPRVRQDQSKEREETEEP